MENAPTPPISKEISRTVKQQTKGKAMNKTQTEIIAAFDAAMQTFVEVWEDPGSSRDRVVMAYGGAVALLIVVKMTTDIDKGAKQAAMLLNQAAEDLGFPANN